MPRVKAKTAREAEPGYGSPEWVDRHELMRANFTKKELKNFLPGTMGMHEALHVSSILCDVVDRELRGHPAVLQDHQSFVLAELAFNSLFDLYQRLGELHLREDETPTVAPPTRRGNS